MYKIGDLWAEGEIDVATEHACTNAANNLIGIINKLVSSSHRNTNHRSTNDSSGSQIKSKAGMRRKNKKILICTPEGELHCLACNILESILIDKGFAVYNISPSVPTYSVLSYLRAIDPDVILISITLVENTNSAIRLVKEISKNFDKKTPIYIGGAAISKSKIYQDVTKLDIPSNISIIEDSSFKGILEFLSYNLSKTKPAATNRFRINDHKAGIAKSKNRSNQIPV